jgi:hypothetical protein
MKSHQETLRSHLEGAGRIQNWAKILGLQMFEDSQDRQAKNEEAENQAFRRMVGGDDATKGSGGDDEMRTTILGDITLAHPQQPATPQKDSGILLPIALATALIAPPVMGLAGAGLAYMMLKQSPPVVQDFEDGSIKLGLGRIEDYLNKDSSK